MRHLARRDSSGWKDCGAVSAGLVDVLEALGAGPVRERFERRVSCTPGAEGAPGAAAAVWVGLVVVGTIWRVWRACC